MARATAHPRVSALVACTAAFGFGGCISPPPGPSVMALPGSRASFEAFQRDDAACRDWAGAQTGVPTDVAAAEAGVGTAAAATAIGAAAGLAFGAVSGNPGAGAAIGAGSGLLVGSAAGSSQARAVAGEVQRRYDSAYVQCMYAKGHRVPVRRSAYAALPPPSRRRPIPPPPAGPPPPPPPGY